MEENKIDENGDFVVPQEGATQRNRLIFKEQMKLLKNQDAHLEDIQVITGKMKEDNRVINEELVLQHQLLDELDQQISKTTSTMKKADLKLRRLIHSSSKF